jgi:hypothetical protein
MERFANAIMGPAKIAYLSDRREPERELNYKFKVLIRRMISSQMVSVTDIVAYGVLSAMAGRKIH